jgi:hypothetical protein
MRPKECHCSIRHVRRRLFVVLRSPFRRYQNSSLRYVQKDDYAKSCVLYRQQMSPNWNKKASIHTRMLARLLDSGMDARFRTHHSLTLE